ncbi:unnamed protein product [Protopolystoma xenopodis]|uniref:Uncharacterized protein n=1 Tax=Protopolystoma xenopodis TaxID=117903 RepID=A0A3S5C6U2_9PLAT|nr:unnamed protein product [Protopolystoma xenopodis]
MVIESNRPHSVSHHLLSRLHPIGLVTVQPPSRITALAMHDIFQKNAFQAPDSLHPQSPSRQSLASSPILLGLATAHGFALVRINSSPAPLQLPSLLPQTASAGTINSSDARNVGEEQEQINTGLEQLMKDAWLVFIN